MEVVKGQVSGNIESFNIVNPKGLGSIESVILWVVPNQTTLKDFSSEISYKLDKLNFTISDENIADISVKRFLINNQPQVAENNQILFVKDGYGYRWFSNKLRDIDGGKNMVPIMNTIIASFKFTK